MDFLPLLSLVNLIAAKAEISSGDILICSLYMLEIPRLYVDIYSVYEAHKYAT